MLRSEAKTAKQEAGFVVCMEAADGSPLQASELVDGVQRFITSGDAADVGNLRYVRVTRGEERSVFVAIWTEGSLPLREMFPRTKGFIGVAEWFAAASDVEEKVMETAERVSLFCCHWGFFLLSARKS